MPKGAEARASMTPANFGNSIGLVLDKGEQGTLSSVLFVRQIERAGGIPMDKPCITDRRIFLKATAALTASAASVVPFSVFAAPARDPGVNILGPKPGYSPQIGTMVSMLTWMQRAAVGPVQGMTQNDLDHLLD